VQLRAFGDEHYHYLTDSAGYTVQYSPAAQAFVYARHDPSTDTIVDTGYPVYTVSMSGSTGTPLHSMMCKLSCFATPFASRYRTSQLRALKGRQQSCRR
jgi:hypothetical protein